MAIDFPNSPANNDVFVAAGTGGSGILLVRFKI